MEEKKAEIKKEIRAPQKEKFNFKKRKENAVHSLFEVEHFLHNFKNIVKGIKLYKIIKW